MVAHDVDVTTVDITAPICANVIVRFKKKLITFFCCFLCLKQYYEPLLITLVRGKRRKTHKKTLFLDCLDGLLIFYPEGFMNIYDLF